MSTPKDPPSYPVPTSLDDAAERRRALQAQIDAIPLHMPENVKQRKKAALRDEIRFIKAWAQAQTEANYTRHAELEAENKALRAEIERLKNELDRARGNR
jgi:multidrug efflux pump subunit AcrA (membrane-fusion protein)